MMAELRVKQSLSVGKVTFEGLAKAFFWLGCYLYDDVGISMHELELRGESWLVLAYIRYCSYEEDGLVHRATRMSVHCGWFGLLFN
jgi:hypothetical protein